MRNRIKIVFNILAVAAVFLSLAGCEEAKRYEISGNDSTPPSPPVFVDSEPLAGGARVFFRPPVDEDVLSIEVAYVNAEGKTLRFAASYFAEWLDVYGFGREGVHAIELYAVDRAGNRSTSVRETVISFEPPVVTVAKSIQVLPSFASMLLKWTNSLQEPVYVWIDYSYTQNGAHHNHTTVFATHQSEMRSIDGLKLYNDELLSVKVNVKDKYGNIASAIDTSIVLLVDEIIPKTAWSFPTVGTEMDGATQADGLKMETVVDGIIEMDFPENNFVSMQNNPWNIIIDLGDVYEISRIVTHQRWSGSNVANNPQGNLYRGDNVMAYNLYGWDETIRKWEQWGERFNIRPPVVKDASEYTVLGRAGDMTFIYPAEPQFSKPTRYIRFEAISGKYISEITLYGRKP